MFNQLSWTWAAVKYNLIEYTVALLLYNKQWMHENINTNLFNRFVDESVFEVDFGGFNTCATS